MSESGDVFREIKKDHAKKRAARCFSNTDLLDDLGVDYRIYNNGYHLAVMSEYEAAEFDFWPSSGRWIERHGGSRNGYDVESLLKAIGVKNKKDDKDGEPERVSSEALDVGDVLITNEGETIKIAEGEDLTRYGYVPHWGYCSGADKARRGNGK